MATIPSSQGAPQASNIAVQDALPLIGTPSRENGQSVLNSIDSDVAKLHEDRNVLLTDGGLITFLGTSVQFTSSLKLSINSRISGGAPQVIDLGSSTRSVSVDGRMIYAVVDRTLGTATITDDAASLPAVVAANKEVFLIAKRMDSPDGIKRLYFRNGSALNEGHTVRLGASGSAGSGSGIGDDLSSLTYKASLLDTFSELSSDANTTIDYGVDKTPAAAHSVVNQYLRLEYDASKTVTGTGTSMTISATPAFTVVAGDILVVGSEAKRITVVTTQTSYTIESAFSSDPSAAACCISQTVYTKDLNAYTGDGLAASSAFTSNINEVLVNYEDTTTLADVIFDINTAPVIAFTASSDGTNYTDTKVRATSVSDILESTGLPSAGTNLYLRFFANKSSGSGQVNLLNYKVFFHRDEAVQDGSVLNQAYCFTDGVGTEINCSAPTVVSGKTRVQLNFTFPVDVNSGEPNGALKVYLNGQKIPRYVDATLTPDASYKEISHNLIELDADYSAFNYSLEIVQDVAVVDNLDVNSTNLAYLQEVQQKGFEDFVDESNELSATTTTGTPVAGTFYSSIVRRSNIPDLQNDLKAHFADNRIHIPQLYEVQDEVGPADERVWAALNDSKNLIRFVGSWENYYPSNAYGSLVKTTTTSDYVEITFKGTGLNMLTLADGNARTAYATINGGTESVTNIFPATISVITGGRSYNQHVKLNVVSDLTEGLYTVKIRNAHANNLFISGFEVLNETSTIKVNPGVAFIGGKKAVLASQQSIAYDSSFESGTLGTKGGNVDVYLKADSNVAKALTPTDSSQLNLTAADHSNSELDRVYHYREFGAHRAAGDDFSNYTGSLSYRSFTLEDGTTTLTGSQINWNTSSDSVWPGTSGAFLIFTFTGVGLDIISGASGSGTLDSHTVYVDGVSIGTITGSITTTPKLFKIVSGLPYGTHTVKILRPSAVNQALGVKQFLVYKPKKADRPSASIELANYNLLADYDSSGVSTTTTAGNLEFPEGTITKYAGREFTHVGSFTYSGISGVADNLPNYAYTSTNSDYIEYTFYGEGFVCWFAGSGSGTSTLNISVDGVLNASGVVLQNMLNGGGGAYTVNTSTINAPARTEFTGLTLDKHTVRFTRTGGSGFTNLVGLHIITPMHTSKSDFPSAVNGALPVGGCSISDERRITPLKGIDEVAPAWVKTLGVASNPTYSTTPFLPVVRDMSCVMKNTKKLVKVDFNFVCRNSSGGFGMFFKLYVDGNPISETEEFSSNGGSDVEDTRLLTWTLPMSPGVHHYQIWSRNPAGTVTLYGNERVLTVREMD